MGRDLLLLRHGFQLGVRKFFGRFHQATDTQNETLKAVRLPTRRTQLDLGMVPFGQKYGEMSFSANWLFGSHHSVRALNGHIMIAPTF